MYFLYLIKGKAEFRVKSKDPETDVNRMRGKIAINNISVSENILTFTCFFSDRKRVCEILGQSGCEILQVKLSGLPDMLVKYRKRAGMFAGAFFMISCIYLSSFFVWDISVEGNENVPDAEIIKELERAGFKTGMLKKKVNIETCVNMLLVNEDRLSWAAINFDGTLAHVEVKEAKIGKRNEVKENVNLIANHNGIIIRADALDGKAVVKKGDVVTEGQLLVSAFVEKRTGGSLLTGARGYVWANTERGYCVVVPLKYYEKMYTDKSEVEFSFSVLGKVVELPCFGKRNFENCEEIVNDSAVCFGDNFRLPLKIIKKTTLEYECYEKRRTQEQALDLAKKEANKRLMTDSPEFVLADIREDYETVGDSVIYKCIFEGVENIAVEHEFELS